MSCNHETLSAKLARSLLFLVWVLSLCRALPKLKSLAKSGRAASVSEFDRYFVPIKRNIFKVKFQHTAYGMCQA